MPNSIRGFFFRGLENVSNCFESDNLSIKALPKGNQDRNHTHCMALYMPFLTIYAAAIFYMYCFQRAL
jgi:hypothetical protein